jgi:hypothetical protein
MLLSILSDDFMLSIDRSVIVDHCDILCACILDLAWRFYHFRSDDFLSCSEISLLIF